MSNPVLDEKKILEINNQLIKLGKKRGYLTYDEINNNFEKVHLDPEMISSFLDLYDAEGIDIVKSEKIVEPQGTEATEEETVLILPEFDNEDEEDENIPADFNAEDEVDLEEKFDDFEFTSQFKINDPVRMYLKEIGRVELLSSQEEINFAKKIERGDISSEILELRRRNESLPVELLERIDLLIKDAGEANDGNEFLIGITELSDEESRRVIHEGEYAKKRLVEANLRLVVLASGHCPS